MIPLNSDPCELHLDYTLTPNGTLALIEIGDDFDTSVEELVRTKKCTSQSCYVAGTDVEKVKGSFKFERDVSLGVVVINAGEDSVKVEGGAYYFSNFRVMDKNKARKVCYESCTFDDAVGTRVVLDYSGSQSSAPVTILTNYGQSEDMLILLFLTPSVVIAFLLPVLVLLTFRIAAPYSSNSNKFNADASTSIKNDTQNGSGYQTYSNNEYDSVNVQTPAGGDTKPVEEGETQTPSATL